MTNLKTIQLHEDVYNKLTEKKKNDQESFNNVMRRLLEMDKEPELKPISYQGQIIMHSLGTDNPDIQDIMSQFESRDIDHHGKYISRAMTIKGIHNVRVRVNTDLMLLISDQSEEEVREAVKTILEGRNLKEEITTTIRGLIYSN